MRILLLCSVLFFAALPPSAARTLDIYFIDVEGGQATLLVAPSGESLLVDTGWPGFQGRDAERIVAAARAAGVKQIDYLLVTHCHRDHVGGAVDLAARMPIINFVDHGPSVETDESAKELFAAYRQVRDQGRHILVKPGDKIPIKGLDIEVLTAAGREIAKPLSGAGQKNPGCSAADRQEDDPSENARSVGILIRYGKFRL